MAIGILDRPARGARDALLDALRENPGASVADLARAIGVVHATATYHLRRLAKAGRVATVRHGNRVHHFLVGATAPRERPLLVCRLTGRAEQVLARVPAGEPQPVGAIAFGLPMTRPGVLYHLERLSRLGLVEIVAGAHGRLYRRVAPEATVRAAEITPIAATA